MPITSYAPARDSAATGNPFEDAASFTTSTQGFVKEQIGFVKGIATESLSDALTNIGQIADFDFEILPPDTVPLPDISQPIWDRIVLDPVTVNDFGTMTPFPDIDVPSGDTLPSITVPTIPGFTGSINGLAIPSSPAAIDVQGPDDAPTDPGVTLPAVPIVTLPDAPDLTNVVIPDFTDPVIPTFSPTYPTFIEQNIDTMITWTEPVYTQVIIDEALTQISTFLAGGSGIDPAVEDAMVARGRDREDRLTFQQEQQATEEWAGKGYTAPPGMLAKRLDTIREISTLKKLGLQREVVIKIHDAELENLRFATQQGIAAEQLFVNIFLAGLERLFEVQKFAVQASLELYNLQVSVFTAKMREVEIRAQVYEVQVRAILATIEVFKARIDAELAKAEVNKSLVAVYEAEIKARQALVDIYVAQVRGASVEADIFGTRIQSYKAKVEAYAVEVEAEKTRFDAYESQIKGELGKANILESEARAYQAEIQGIDTGVRAQVAALQGEVSKIEAQIRGAVAEIQAATGQGTVELGAIQANVAGYQADTSRFLAQAGEEEARAKVDLAAYQTEENIGLKFFEAQVTRFRANQSAIIEHAKIALAALTASGELSSTIGAGAMAAMHVGAQLSGGSQVNASGTDSVGFRYSSSDACDTSTSSSIKYEAESASELPDLSCN